MNEMNYIVDLLFLLFGAVTVFIFAKRGFFLSLLKFFKLLLSFIAAYLWGNFFGNFLSEKVFYTPIRNSVFEKINGVYQSAAETFNAQSALEAVPKFLRTDSLVEKVNSLEGNGEVLVNSITDSVAGALSAVICSVLGFLAVFVFAFLALTIVYFLIKGLRSKLKLLGMVDTLLGALLGVIFVWIVLLVIGSLLKFFFGADAFYTKSIIVKFFGESSILETLQFLNINNWLSNIGSLTK